MAKAHGPWTIIATTRLFCNDFLELAEDQVIDPAGKLSSYATVRLAPGVAILPLADDGRAYLTRQFRYAIGCESLEVPSGAIDEGESPCEAAAREIREELGIEAAEWQELGIVHPVTSTIDGPVHLFVARGLRFTESEREPTEQIETVTLPLSEVVERVMAGEITHAPSCAVILKAARRGLLSAADQGAAG